MSWKVRSYTVYRVFKDTDEKEVLYTDLTREEAAQIVQASPSENGSMVVFDKQ
tara:strand:- start:222 stop:380 length:159 start_codon:yes stop_codon:yes gene_type:complete